MRRRIAALGCLLALAAGGCAPRPEEPEGGYCVYYSALSDRFAPLPLDCEPFEGSGGDPIPALVDALLSPPETQGLASPFPEGVRLLSWEVEEGRLHLDLSEQYGGLSGVDLTVADACLTLTLCQVEGVESVYVTVEGREIPYRRVQQLGPDGLLLTDGTHGPPAEAGGLGRALEACTVRPVWITVDVPQDAAPGLYRTPVTVACDGDEQRLELAVEVTGRTLPAPSEWRYHLDLWQHPAAVARVEGTEMWSDAHFEALRPVMKPLADAGQKVVTATLNKDPWNNQCYDAYADMIVWTKGADGAWTYDYAAFDRWVEFMEGLGVDKQINCYSMLPWNNMLHYRDAATGEWVDVKAEPGQPAFDEMWRPFLADFVRHLEEKGWLAKTCIAMDERSPEQMEIAVAFLAEHAPQLGIALADNHDSYKRYPQLHDICVSARQEVAPEDIAARRAAGQVTTYYVCCSHRYPNMFTFSDPAEATVAAWYAVANGYDGFLRWAYNSWTEDPLRDSRFRTWPAGDTYVVYPGGRSSIRFERLREGIQDAEKIRILRAEAGRGNSAGADEKRARLEAVIAPFASREPAADLHERLAEAKRVLNEL